MRTTLQQAFSATNPAAAIVTAQVIVRVYQDELLRTGFLLTGSAAVSSELASESLYAYLDQTPPAGIDDDARIRLLRHLTNRFSQEPARTSSVDTGPDILLAEPAPRRFQVEDDRARLRAALDRLDRPARLGLVLREFNRLSEDDIAAVTGESPSQVRTRTNQALQRVARDIGLAAGEPLSVPLTRLAVGAPRVDLWEQLEAPVRAGAMEQHRRQRLLTFGVIGMVLLLVLGVGFWLFNDGADDSKAAVADATPTRAATIQPERPSPTPGGQAAAPATATPESLLPPVEVPEIWFLQATAAETVEGQAAGSGDPSATIYYNPTNGDWLALPPESRSWVSPDGAWRFHLYQTGFDRQRSQETLAAVSTADLTLAWETQVSDILDLTTAGERVYAATWSIESPTVLVVRSIDLATGAEVDAKPVQLVNPDGSVPTSSASPIARLVADPERDLLYLTASRTMALGSVRQLTTLHLPSLGLVGSTSTNQESEDELAGYPRLAADQRTLYSGIFRNNDRALSIDFLDLRSGLFQRLDVPLRQGQTERWSSTALVPSNDGTRLYVLDLRYREVIIVDLRQQSIERVFPIDTGESGGFDSLGVTAEGVNWLIAALAPDGSRVYLTQGGSSPSTGTSQPLWVLDTTTWRIEAVWSLPARPSNLITNADGTGLWIQPFPVSSDPLPPLFVDTATGHMSDAQPLPGLEAWTASSIGGSLAAEYAVQYGRAPARAAVAPSDLPLQSTLPRVVVAAESPFLPAGSGTTITVQMLDPQTGDPITSRRAGVRYDPSASVLIRLVHQQGEAADVLLAPNRDGARLTATANLDPVGWWNTDGWWDAVVAVTNPDGSYWEVTIPEVIQVVPSFEGSDGNRYALQVRTAQDPTVDSAVTLFAAFVEVSTGGPLPDGVTLLTGVPDQLQAQLSPAGNDGFTSVDFLPVAGNGRYQGLVHFWEAGKWVVTVRFRDAAGDWHIFPAGAITVVDS
jgi:hypothetical protein